MARFIFSLMVLAAAAPAAAFEIERRGFERSLFATAQEQPSPDPEEEEERRVLEDWNSRGWGLSLVGTFALVFPGAGIGLELAMPVHQNVSITLEAGLIGGIFYEGAQFQAGARGFLDLHENFAFTLEAGIKVGSGRVLDYIGGSPKDPVESPSIGGFCNPGLEVGSRHVRFFTEITLNGADTLETHYEVEFFCGFNLGLRIYFGA